MPWGRGHKGGVVPQQRHKPASEPTTRVPMMQVGPDSGGGWMREPVVTTTISSGNYSPVSIMGAHPSYPYCPPIPFSLRTLTPINPAAIQDHLTCLDNLHVSCSHFVSLLAIIWFGCLNHHPKSSQLHLICGSGIRSGGNSPHEKNRLRPSTLMSTIIVCMASMSGFCSHPPGHKWHRRIALSSSQGPSHLIVQIAVAITLILSMSFTSYYITIEVPSVTWHSYNIVHVMHI